MSFRIDIEDEEQSQPLHLEAVMGATCRNDHASIWREYVDDLNSSNDFIAFQSSLIDHMWIMAGEAV